MATLDTTQKYAIFNSYTGPNKRLSSSSNGNEIELDSSALASKHQWYFTATTGPFYRLRTIANGDSQSLDVLNDNGTSSTSVRFAPTEVRSGQYWRIDPWGDGSFRLSNNFTGPDKHLDVYADILVPYLAPEDRSGQHWTVSQITVSSSATSRSGTASTTSTTTPASNGTSTAAAGKGGISTGAIAGIVAGGVLVCAIFIAFVVLLCRRKRRSVTKSASTIYYEDASPMSQTRDAYNGNFTYAKYKIADQAELDGGHHHLPTELPAISVIELPSPPAASEMDAVNPPFRQSNAVDAEKHG